MKKQELEELRRLEEELLASEYAEEDFLDEIDLLEDTWQDLADLPADIRNTDRVDVDLDMFSDTLTQDSKRGIPAGLALVLIIILLCITAFCAMKMLGVM